MGLWSGHNISKEDSPEQRTNVAQQELDKAFKLARKDMQPPKQNLQNFNKGAFQVGKSTGEAVLAGMQQRPSFTREQEMLGEMFGHGEKIWGTNNNPVTINNDLNSARSDPWDETSSMFGSGPFSERSGLF